MPIIRTKYKRKRKFNKGRKGGLIQGRDVAQGMEIVQGMIQALFEQGRDVSSIQKSIVDLPPKSIE